MKSSIHVFHVFDITVNYAATIRHPKCTGVCSEKSRAVSSEKINERDEIVSIKVSIPGEFIDRDMDPHAMFTPFACDLI